MSTDTSKAILDAIRSADPDVMGSVTVKVMDGTTFVGGQIHSRSLTDSSLEKLIREAVASDDLVVTRLLKKGLTVASQENLATTEDPEGVLDEVDVTYQGYLEANRIQANDTFKKINHETLVKIKRAVEVVGFVAPIVLDSTFRVIDGNLRLAVIRKLYGDDTARRVPVIVINDSGAKADFLRLVLNRSSEFQRWIYPEVDQYVDAMPQVQPVLEPLGFYANKILPNSFFGGTVVEYKLDEYNDQQKMYSQDIGLAAWAEKRRGEILAAEEARKEERDRKKRPSEGMAGLFDLEPAPEDFVETYDMTKELRDHTLHMRDVAGTITDNYDAKRKAEKEARGQEWQTSRRGSKTKAADKRAEAEAKAAEAVDEPVEALAEDEVFLDE